jgi:hypothetical protein
MPLATYVDDEICACCPRLHDIFMSDFADVTVIEVVERIKRAVLWLLAAKSVRCFGDFGEHVDCF